MPRVAGVLVPPVPHRCCPAVIAVTDKSLIAVLLFTVVVVAVAVVDVVVPLVAVPLVVPKEPEPEPAAEPVSAAAVHTPRGDAVYGLCGGVYCSCGECCKKQKKNTGIKKDDGKGGVNIGEEGGGWGMDDKLQKQSGIEISWYGKVRGRPGARYPRI